MGWMQSVAFSQSEFVSALDRIWYASTMSDAACQVLTELLNGNAPCGHEPTCFHEAWHIQLRACMRWP